MKIGIDASRANSLQRTGVENYAFHVIQELKKIIPASVEVMLYSREPLIKELSELPHNWKNRVLAWPPKRLWTQVRLSIEMIVDKPDVLFIPAHVFPLIRPKKTLMTIHDVAALRFPETYNWFEKWYSVWSAKYAVNHLWKICTPSEFTKKELVHFFGVQAADKISVTPLGIDEVYAQLCSTDEIEQVKKKFSITKPFIMTLGRMEEKKNTQRVVEAFNILKQDHDIQLVLAGMPGFGYEKTLKHIVESEYRNDIIQTGWISPEEARALLASTNIFVFPSLYEGFGLPVLEAFASKAPVITTKGHSTEEIAGSSALYADAQDSSDIACVISSLLTSPDTARTLVEKGSERLKQYTWQCTAELTKNILLSD